MMSNVIRQIGPVYLDDVVKSWIGQVRKVAFRVEDVMDKYVYHVLQLQREGFLKKLFIKGTHYVQDFNKIVNEVVLIEEEIQLVIQIKEECLQPAQLVRITEMERQRSRNSLPEFVKDEDVIGFESNRILLTGWLYSEEPESTVITVSGMGGLGKSTLVSNVYERQKINFPAHAWITVSQIYTVDILLRELLWKIGYTEQPLSAGIDKMTVYDLRMEIQQRLKNIKCLIILDDVWAQEVYFQIQGAFQNLQGSRIIITTRNCHVAAVSSPTRHLELEPLSHDDSFDLLCRRAFYNKKGHMCPDELRRIADQIIGKCWGQPLAIVTIGSMLSSTQRLDFWEQTYNRLRSELSRNDQVRAILSKSYHDLSGDLRNCFLYCSLFPEDYIISRETLVRLWVAEGFVLRNENNTPEEVAERNLMELIHRNMLKVVENCELGGVKSCVMHPIVRDLAISVAKEVRFSTTDDHGTLIQMDKDVRRVSILWKQNTMQKLKLPHLRTVVTREEKSYHISSNCRLSWILSASCYLTVLKIQDSEVTEVPASIGHLFNLRYISLRRSKVNSLPNSIENLYNLQTLDVRETNIVNLPQGIVKIKKLRHLLADRYAHRTEFPYSVRPQAPEDEFPYSVGVQAPEELSNMEELQTLETLNSSKDLEKQLRPLRQLRSVCIDNIRAADCENLFITLSERPLLSSLLLSARDENEALCFEELMPREPNVLRRLIIRGQWAKGTLDCPIFVHYGRWLKYLWLSWCHIGEDPVGLLAPHMPNLTFLRLSDMHSANTLVISSESFPNLKTLVLNHMPDVSELNIIDGALPCIEGLYIEWLPKLTKVPQGIKSLRSLKKLRLISLNCSFASQWKTNEMSAKMRHVRDVDVY